VTLGEARERIAKAQRARDLPHKEDGATRLARALLTADKIHFLVAWRSTRPRLPIKPAFSHCAVPLLKI